VATPERHPAQDWRIIVGVFWLTQLIEGLGVSQVFALLPAYLRELGVPDSDRLAFVGLYSSLVFVVGLPLVPLWGVWADKFSRKVVIVRSALVEAVVFGLAALAREPWQLAVAVLLIGFQLGNTGVMLAGIRDVSPRRRLGTTIALFGAAGPIGFAVGPALAGLLIDGLGWPIAGVFGLSAGLSVATALLVGLGTREVRPEVVPVGPVLRLAFGAVRGVFADPVVRRLFIVYGVVFLANQMSRPYTPVLVEDLVGTGPGLATGIALVMGVAALVGAVASPGAGWMGDRFGFRPVLVAALVVGGAASLLMPVMPGLASLAIIAVALGAAVATTGAMVFSMLATEVPPERRSTTLNLVYLPLYIAGIVGPALGGGLAAVGGAAGPFLAGGVVFLAGALALAVRRAPPARQVAPPGEPASRLP
jgi:DHA1 family multidrug resistance protein-like MFS transporter